MDGYLRAASRAAIAKSTPGPWRLGVDDLGHEGVVADAVLTEHNLQSLIVDARFDRDAEFIVIAKEALPEALDALDRILALHVKEEWNSCSECMTPEYPCPTVQALVGPEEES